MNDPSAIAKGTVQYGPQQAHVYGQDESKGVLLMPLNTQFIFSWVSFSLALIYCNPSLVCAEL